MTGARLFWIATAAFTLAGAVLRLKGIHAPIFDHPSWRQGDTAAIARNFAQLQYNIFFPQVDYNGPPPNYVELELQIVPFLAATLYKIFGVHEVFGRLISLGFGVATLPVLAAFGRYLFRSGVAGVAAAAAYAVFPGAWYYSHTFMPDSAMVFFTVCAVYAAARAILEERTTWREWTAAGVLLMLAFLAKPVAVTAAIPIAACAIARYGWAVALRKPGLWACAAGAFVPLIAYDAFVSSHAEWHWASGITRLHVLPSLRDAFTSPHAFAQKAVGFAHALRMLATTMVGPFGIVFALAGLAVPLRSRGDALLWGWLGGGLLYAYVVVTVERVDYYLYLLLPPAALAIGRLCAYCFDRRRDVRTRTAVAAASAVLWIAGAIVGYAQIRPYYVWNRDNYVRAKQLSVTLEPGTLVVMGHYDPSLLYAMGHKGWEEDPHLWTPFDEQSAIRKGARYFISVEHARLKQTNLELYCWLSRFAVLDPAAKWPVYQTDPGKVLPGAEDRWRAFRRREMAGAFAHWRQDWKSLPDPCP